MSFMVLLRNAVLSKHVLQCQLDRRTFFLPFIVRNDINLY